MRKALGAVYLEGRQFERAAEQLRLAIEQQPNDRETHEKLIACFDGQADKQGAVRQLLESAQLSRRDLALYRDLGRRYAELKDPQQAERAYTTIVEMLPSESESHALLAEIRQEQDRWNEAIQGWQRVAEIRALEPTGLLKLGAAQVQLKNWDGASETARRLRARGWPSRFGDVEAEIRRMERQIDEGRAVKRER